MNEKIVVGIATFRRDDDCLNAVKSVQQIIIPPGKEISIVVCSNETNSVLFKRLREISRSIDIVYLEETRRGIPFVRNKILEFAKEVYADYLAFVDDDEIVERDWLKGLVETQDHFQSTVATGRVIAKYGSQIPNWVKDSQYFDKNQFETGRKMFFAATSNVLYDLHFLRRNKFKFDERFVHTGGTDNFLAADILRVGGSIIYCNEAVVIEEVSPERATMKWMALRTFRCRSNDVIYYKRRYNIVKAYLRVLKQILIKLYEIGCSLLVLIFSWRKVNLFYLLNNLMGLFGYLAGTVNFHYDEYKRIDNAKVSQ